VPEVPQCLLQAALAAANDSVELRPHRLLFKQRQQAEGDESLQAMLHSMSQGGAQERRLLQGAEGPSSLQIQPLGSHSGISMVQVPDGVSKADLLRALQEHPGPCPAALRWFTYWCTPPPWHGYCEAGFLVHLSYACMAFALQPYQQPQLRHSEHTASLCACVDCTHTHHLPLGAGSWLLRPSPSSL
jgi:hypothetical protein